VASPGGGASEETGRTLPEYRRGGDGGLIVLSGKHMPV